MKNAKWKLSCPVGPGPSTHRDCCLRCVQLHAGYSDRVLEQPGTLTGNVLKPQLPIMSCYRSPGMHAAVQAHHCRSMFFCHARHDHVRARLHRGLQ